MIVETYNQFLDKFFKELERQKIDLSKLTLDHIGYQVSSKAEYDKLKSELKDKTEIISENVVGGRRVCILKLLSPLLYKTYKIEVLEVIEPKEKQTVISNWEHVEMITQDSLEDFMEKYPESNWDTSAIDREEFPMLILKLKNEIRVKFPRLPVLEEIKRQKRNDQ